MSQKKETGSPTENTSPARFPDCLVGRKRAHWLLAAVSLALFSLIFAPIGIWPLAFVCLVPWLVLVGGSGDAPRVYRLSYVMALAFFLINMRWMYAATGLGYFALAIYQSLYFPFAAIPLRHVVRRRRWPLALAFPIVWTGTEMLRTVLVADFPWFLLSHSLHGVLTLIQVSDLVGSYGVTFMIAAVTGAVADWILAKRAASRRIDVGVPVGCLRRGSLFAGVLVVVVAIYGQIQLHRDTTRDGPKIALIQGDFLNSVDSSGAVGHDKMTNFEKMRVYLSMMDAAAAEKPDLFLLPESPWTMFLNPQKRSFGTSRISFNELQRRATGNNAYVVTGSATWISTPDDLLAKNRIHNSATVFNPEGTEPGRYDKRHLVLFGEYVPFRFGRLRFLYFWLNSIMPFRGIDGSSEYSSFPGEEFLRFKMEAGAGRDRAYNFSIPICYEDVMPYVAREFAYGGDPGGKKVDFLLNISNDGWFGRGIQQPQHMAICTFRAVENRVGVARAVNTGVSGFIQPSGRVHDLVTPSDGDDWPGRCGFSVARVGVDTRFTFYSRWGDWFAWTCAAIWAVLFLDYWVARVRALNG